MTFAEIFSALAVLGTLFSIWSQRRFIASQAATNFSQVDSNNIKDALTLKQEYRKALEEIRLELDQEQEARKAVEKELVDAHALIAELQRQDAKREAAMRDLQEQFNRDSLLRANVERALNLANEKIAVLEAENRAMSSRLSVLENERVTWRAGIKTLIQQVVELGAQPLWKPADTQPLGKLAT